MGKMKRFGLLILLVCAFPSMPISNNTIIDDVKPIAVTPTVPKGYRVAESDLISAIPSTQVEQVLNSPIYEILAEMEDTYGGTMVDYMVNHDMVSIENVSEVDDYDQVTLVPVLAKPTQL